MTKIPMINLDDDDAAEQLAAAIGAKPGDAIQCVTKEKP